MDREALEHYGRRLVTEAGFHVWITPMTPGAFLTYEDPATGYWGTFQYSTMEGWKHLMPITPSKEFGSHMHLDSKTDPWTVEAAKECASASNYNSIVGRQRNRAYSWLSDKAIPLHAAA